MESLGDPVSQLAPRHHYSFTEYLELEEVAQVRHEFYDGEIYALAGGTPEHAAMAAAITLALGRQLAGSSCRVYSSDLRVRVLPTGLATYPDVSVICGPLQRDPESHTHVTNPVLVVEITSPSTALYDHGKKLEHYRQVSSLKLVLLVDHKSPHLLLWSRAEDAWSSQELSSGEVAQLTAIGCELAVDEIYAAAREA